MVLFAIILSSLILPFNALANDFISDFQSVTNKNNGLSSPIYGEKASPFVYDFLMATLNSDDLQNIMAKALEEAKNLKVFYNIVFKSAIEYEVPDPHAAATSITNAIHTVLDIMTPLSTAKMCARSLEHLLNDHGLLSITNSDERARQLKDCYLDLERTVGPRPAPDDYWRVLAEGGLKFINLFDLDSPVTAEDLVGYITQELYALKSF